MDRDRWWQALGKLETSMSAEKRDPPYQTYWLLAVCYYNQSQWEECVEALEEALARKPYRLEAQALKKQAEKRVRAQKWDELLPYVGRRYASSRDTKPDGVRIPHGEKTPSFSVEFQDSGLSSWFTKAEDVPVTRTEETPSSSFTVVTDGGESISTSGSSARSLYKRSSRKPSKTTSRLSTSIWKERSVKPTASVRPKPMERSNKDFPPPKRIRIWLYIYKGKTYANRLVDFNYPGTVEVESYFRRAGQVVVILQSTFNRAASWELYLPQREGEHYVDAKLKE
jgi:hypothetical protein